jgi:hypothetical protein
MFSHNAAENPYWRNPAWYDRDRSLFRRYLPLIRQVAEAGWQPVTEAVCDNSTVLVERFGPAADGTTFYTLFNDATTGVRTTLRLTGEQPDASASLRATELLSGQRLPWTGQGWAVAVDPQSAALVRIETPSRFRSIKLDPRGGVRLTVEAPLGLAQVLESSSNLDNWIPLATNTIHTVPMELADRLRAAERQAFYRLRLAAKR